MKRERFPFDVLTIRAAVDGEAWAVEKVIEIIPARLIAFA